MYNTAISEYEIQSTTENNFLLDFKKCIRVFFHSFAHSSLWVYACDIFPSNQQWIEFHLFATYLYFLKFILHSSFTYIWCVLLCFSSTSLHLFLSFLLRCRLSLSMRLEWKRGGGVVNSNISNEQTWSEQKSSTHSTKENMAKKWIERAKKNDNILANCVRLVTQYCR